MAMHGGICHLGRGTPAVPALEVAASTPVNEPPSPQYQSTLSTPPLPALATTIAAVTATTVLLASALIASVTVVMMAWCQRQSVMADADVATKAMVDNGKGAQPIAIVAVNGSHATTCNT